MDLVCVRDYEERAADILSKSNLDYFAGGAGHTTTVNLNRESYQRLRLRPKCLRDVSKLDPTFELFGSKMTMPLGVAPTAFHKIAHPDGELATARAAENCGVIYIQSTMSTCTIEQVAEAAPKAHKWLQLYFYTDRSVSESLIRRAENAGYEAIVLTVDSPTRGCRYEMLRSNWDLPVGVKQANLQTTDPDGNETTLKVFSDKSLTWEGGVKWLVNCTKLPVIAKGILRADDALMAIEVGCKGVIVSNHGGRNVDTAPATIEVLPEIVQAVRGRVPVMVDGGVTLGTDVLKALAFGADVVFIGRPIIWGLTVNGREGVEGVLNIFRKELETTMMLCGTPKIKDITRDLVVHPSYYVEQLLKYQRST